MSFSSHNNVNRTIQNYRLTKGNLQCSDANLVMCSFHRSAPVLSSSASATAMLAPTAALFFTRAMLDTSDAPPARALH